jgi:uncharacterized OsmC-like protein
MLLRRAAAVSAEEGAVMSPHEGFTIHMEQLDAFEFKVKFDWENADELLMDEPEPMGGSKGPNATRLLAAAVANCLSASLVFCLTKARVDVKGVKSSVRAMLERNEQKRLRIGGLEVEIVLPDEVAASTRGMERCLGLFEDYCIVTASVRSGIDVGVRVTDQSGNQLFKRAEA